MRSASGGRRNAGRALGLGGQALGTGSVMGSILNARRSVPIFIAWRS
jgi:hypothetical protein